ncbi:MAG: hypothetical protein HY553_21895 [Elusimicrobia bacterium]|nr:hypothetical protein [Elusimicrobiota bacterium]
MNRSITTVLAGVLVLAGSGAAAANCGSPLVNYSAEYIRQARRSYPGFCREAGKLGKKRLGAPAVTLIDPAPAPRRSAVPQGPVPAPRKATVRRRLQPVGYGGLR